jgi:hypothetical protein
MNDEKKTCFDCLHCKVSKKTRIVRLCFCEKTIDKEKHRDPYWLSKRLCKRFVDMSA